MELTSGRLPSKQTCRQETDYVQTMNEELNKIKELRIEFQNKLKQ